MRRTILLVAGLFVFGSFAQTAAPPSRSGQLLLDGATAHRDTLPPAEMTFTPDGQTLVLGISSRVRQWDTAMGRESPVRIEHDTIVVAVAVSPDGKMVASADVSGEIRLHERATGKRQHRFSGQATEGYQVGVPYDFYQKGIARLAFVAEGNRFIAANRDGSIWNWDVASGNRLSNLREGGQRTSNILLSPDGFTLASLTGDRITLHDLRTGRRIGVIDDQTAKGKEKIYWKATAIWPALFSPDGKYLLVGRKFEIQRRSSEHSASADVLILIEVATRKEATVLESPPPEVSFVFRSDGRAFLSGEGNSYGIRGSEDKGGDTSLPAMKEGRFPLLLSPNGKILAVGSKGGRVWLQRITASGRPPGTEERLSPGKLREVWTDLSSLDSARGHRAIETLLGRPKQALLLFRERLRRAEALGTTNQLTRWIEDLESDQYATREKARLALEQMGERAEYALRRALANRPSVEAWLRINRLLDRMNLATPDRLRVSRAITVLERAQMAEMRRLLVWLSKGTVDDPLTQEASGAVRRIGYMSTE